MKALKKRATVGIDLDGVLANQISDILPLINTRYGVTLSYEDIIQWDLPVKDTNIAEIIKEEQRNRDYILNMPLHAHAGETMKLLSASHRVAVVTARKPEITAWSHEWLRKNEIPFAEFDCTVEREKHLSKLELDLLIDDYLGNIEGFLAGCRGKAILFSQPWNKTRSSIQPYLDNQRLSVVNSWPEVPLAIEKLLVGA